MGFTEKQLQALRRASTAGMSARARPMVAKSPTSKAGTRSRKPTGSLALMVGIGRRWTPAASWRGKTAAHFSPSMSPKCALLCRPMQRPLCAKVMVLVRAGAPRRARSTTLRLRRPRPMPPSERWRRSANRSDSSSIEKTKTSPCKGCQRSIRRPQVHQLSRASVHTLTIRHRSRGRRITMGGGMRAQWLNCFARTRQEHEKTTQRRRPCALTKSTRVNSPLPSRSACATRHTLNSWPHNRAWSAGGSHPTRIICVLRSRGQSGLRSATNSRCRYAAAIIGNYTRPATKRPGGKISRLMPSNSQGIFGRNRILRRFGLHPHDSPCTDLTKNVRFRG